MLERGHSPATLLTTRHEGKPYDNFIPKPIGELAKWTASEDDAHGVHFRKYRPWSENGSSPMRAEGAELPRKASSAKANDAKRREVAARRGAIVDLPTARRWRDPNRNRAATLRWFARFTASWWRSGTR